MGQKRRARVGALAVAAFMFALGACSTAEPEQTADASTTPIDTALLECGAATDEEPTWQLTEVDLSATTWSTPTGFVESFAYEEDKAVERVESFWAAEPEENPVVRNVLIAVIYSDLNWGDDLDQCGRVPVTALEERLNAYLERNDADALADVGTTEIAGLQALTQDVALDEYSYRGYWIFGRTQMVHLYCQWTAESEKDRILQGCDELLNSVEVTNA